MKEQTPRVDKITAPDGTEYRVFDCPGCKDAHVLPVTGPRKWGFNFNDAAPTFDPSILARRQGVVCHSFVRDGQIQFLSDCTHPLAGQTVPLSEVKDDNEA
jgi:hypothetical protein